MQYILIIFYSVSQLLQGPFHLSTHLSSGSFLLSLKKNEIKHKPKQNKQQIPETKSKSLQKHGVYFVFANYTWAWGLSWNVTDLHAMDPVSWANMGVLNIHVSLSVFKLSIFNLLLNNRRCNDFLANTLYQHCTVFPGHNAHIPYLALLRK